MAGVSDVDRVTDKRRLFEDGYDSRRAAYGTAGNSAFIDAHRVPRWADHADRSIDPRGRLEVVDDPTRWKPATQPADLGHGG